MLMIYRFFFLGVAFLSMSVSADELVMKCDYMTYMKRDVERNKIDEGARFFRLVENEISNEVGFFMYSDDKGRWIELKKPKYGIMRVNSEEIIYRSEAVQYQINRVTAKFYGTDYDDGAIQMEGSCARSSFVPKDKSPKF